VPAGFAHLALAPAHVNLSSGRPYRATVGLRCVSSAIRLWLTTGWLWQSLM
jgi:hypothetical protein